MKKTLLLLLLLVPLLLVLFSCSTMSDNIAARTGLKDCKFTFVKIVPKKVRSKGMKIRSVDFDVYMKVTNKSKGIVVLDHIESKIYLDSHKVAELTNKDFNRIEKGKSKTVKFRTSVPFGSAVKALGSLPDKITIDAKIYLNLIMGKKTLKDVAVINRKVSYPIPYDKIKKMIKKKVKDKLNISF